MMYDFMLVMLRVCVSQNERKQLLNAHCPRRHGGAAPIAYIVHEFRIPTRQHCIYVPVISTQ